MPTYATVALPKRPSPDGRFSKNWENRATSAPI